MYTFRLTALTSLNITGDMKLIDVNGNSHEFTSYHVHMMMIVGWVCFILAWILNIVYYFLHPSAVDFELSRLHEKLKIPVFGNIIWDISKTFKIDKKLKATSEDPSVSIKKIEIEEEVKESIPQVIVDKAAQSPVPTRMDEIHSEQSDSKDLIPIRKEKKSKTIYPVAVKKDKTDVSTGNHETNVLQEFSLDDVDEEDSVTYV